MLGLPRPILSAAKNLRLLLSHGREHYSLLGTGFGRYLIERKISVCTATVAHTTTRAISY